MPNDATPGRPNPGRHRAARHRGPTRYERTRDRVCDSLADTVDALPRPRTIAVGALGGVVATGVAVGAPTVMAGADESGQRTPDTSVRASVHEVVQEADQVSRGAARAPIAAEVTDPKALEAAREADAKALKQQKVDAEKAAEAAARAKALASQDPRDVARQLLADRGWGDDEFSCLDAIWTQESGWRVSAENPGSGAYGIPQALPGSKMASAGSDWRTNPRTQITWGLGYIEQRYGTPCSANAFKKSHGWY